MNHCMIDLETLSTSPDAAILSIGACAFDGKNILGTFYQNVELESCIRAGLRVDASTVYWWLQQSEAARKALLLNRVGLAEALHRLFHFYSHENAATIWSHGASFDLPILQTAYEKCSIKMPWGYRHARDTRTLYDAKNYETKLVNGDAHNALSDAIFQAKCVMEAMSA